MSRLRMTPRGWSVMGASLVAIGAGLLAVEGSLMAAGVTGVVLFAGARQMCGRNLAGVDLERTVPESTFAGDPFEIGYRLRARGKRFLGASAVSFEDMLTRGIPPVFCNRVDADGVSARLESRIEARGVVTSGDVLMNSDYPLGLFEAERSMGVGSRMIVYPRPLMTKAMAEAEEALDLDELANATVSDGSDHFRGVREFRNGDPVMRIHWPATARSGIPMVREFDPPAPQPSHFTLIFHSYSPPGHLLRPRAFEIALSMITGLVLQARKVPASLSLTGRLTGWTPVEVNPGEPTGEILELLAFARYRPEKSPEALRRAVRGLRHDRGARTFVISDTPVELWSGLLPKVDRPLACLDTAGNFRKIVRTVSGAGAVARE